MASTSAGHITLHQQELQALLNTTEGLQQQRKLMQRIGRALHADAKMRFRQGKAPDGTPWPRLKGPPLGHRRKKGQPPQPGQALRDSGRLQRSIDWEATDQQVVIGTNAVYARAHNDGVPGKLPRRQFLGIAAPQVQMINRIADKWIKEVLDGNPA